MVQMVQWCCKAKEAFLSLFKLRQTQQFTKLPIVTVMAISLGIQLEQLQAISQAIPIFIESNKFSLPILGLDDSDNNTLDSISGLRSFRDSLSKEIEVLEQSKFSTNALYFIAVWNELISAPWPVVALGKIFPSPAGNHGTDMQNKSVKIDVVADEGKTWIRINTIKNSKLIAEFRELDSYLTESEDETEKSSDVDVVHGNFPTYQDNSLLQMGRALMRAGSIAWIGSNEKPKIVLRLTRLDPARGQDSRIGQVINDLRRSGLDVQLGERPFRTTRENDNQNTSPILCQPTNRVNLDLSVLIALISDLTHADLPSNREEAKSRFSTSLPQCHIHHDEKRQCTSINLPTDDGHHPDDAGPGPVGHFDREFTKHSRALFLQCLQEMDRGILNELVEKLSARWPIESVEFWTSDEARDRALQIVEKVGGSNEKHRARVLFHDKYDNINESPDLAPEFWKNSRFPPTFFPSLFPIRIHRWHPEDSYETKQFRNTSLFQSRLAQTCRYILKDAATPHPRLFRKYGEMGQVKVSSLNPKLTMHTVKSMLLGCYEGMTTLTANKASVRALIREMKVLENQNVTFLENNCDAHLPKPTQSRSDAGEIEATIWIIEPRSLSENMQTRLP